MAWCDIKFSCGHEGSVQLYGSGAERERKKWYYENRGLCPECLEKKREADREARRAAEKEAGLCVAFRAGMRRDLEKVDGEERIVASRVVFAVFEGDTYPRKEELKAIGARWRDDYPGGSALGYIVGASRPCKRWVVEINEDNAEEKVGEIAELGANVVELPDDLSASVIGLYVGQMNEER